MNTTSKALPKIFDHCVRVYDAMVQRAKVSSSDGEPQLVFDGPLSTLIVQELRLSPPYYSMITRELKRMGCVRQLQSGRGGHCCRWELLRVPSEKNFTSTLNLRDPVSHHERRLKREFNEAAAHFAQACAELQGNGLMASATSSTVQTRAGEIATSAQGNAVIVVIQMSGAKSSRAKKKPQCPAAELHVQAKGEHWFIVSASRPDLCDGPYRTRDAAEQTARRISREQDMQVIIHRKEDRL